MSATTTTTTTVPKPGQFPGNCTLEEALKSIMKVFHQYSVRTNNPDSLSFDEFKVLLEEQASHFLEVCNRNRPSYLPELFKETDINHDSQLSFEEFVIVLAKITNDVHLAIHKQDRCKPDKD